ncbi:MAG TPA: DUF4419 domain-containing protein [Bryobacteraceae bacterium]|nr:DUF4419 domain-containing protein [Bryobacteraceae bacterium]
MRFSGPVSGLRFAVDDVQASNEILDRSELLAVVRNRLHRGVLLGPLGGRAVLSWSDANPLIDAIHLAFSRHLPLTFSPDAIWLTIVQGFSHHVIEHAETLRGRLVNHKERCTLNEDIAALEVAEVTAAVSGISRQIRDATDPALHDALLCDFTTTTPDIRVASEIALMDTYSPYFDYSLSMCICGIPNITLTGTVEDWQRIRERIEVLETFGLEWWVSRLRPILDEFVRAASGRPERDFWRGMYKFRPPTGFYDSERVTGWIVDLFPYLRDDRPRTRNPAFEPGGEREIPSGAFPCGLSSVNVVLKLLNGSRELVATQELELVGGLLAVEQSPLDAALSPTISWCLASRPPEKAPEIDMSKLF